MNESIYYNVDRIHTAIAENSRITFQYFQWNVDKKMELRHDGALYEVSPWALSWDDENYYLIAYDSKKKIIKHFRVDKKREETGRKGCFSEVRYSGVCPENVWHVWRGRRMGEAGMQK